ncbi:hypothetical protein Tco_0377389 [Tanacetum coccineum]
MHRYVKLKCHCSLTTTDCVALLSPSSSKGGKGAKEGKGQSERGKGGDRNQTTRSLAVEKATFCGRHTVCNTLKRYVVPTGRVVVPTGRYVVPAGKVIIIVSPDEHIAVQWNQKARNYLASVYFKARLGGGKAWNPRKHECSRLFFIYLHAPSNSKTGSHRSGNVIEDVLQSFVADTEPEQLAYEDFEQIEKLDLEEMDLKWQMVMLSVRVHKFEQKAGRKIDFDKKESARFNKKKVRCYKSLQRCHFARECRAKGGNDKQRYSSFKIQEIGKKKEDSKALITIDTLVDLDRA